MAIKKTSVKLESFNVQITYKAVKYLRLKVTKDGLVLVSAPFFTSKQSIVNLVEKNRAWISGTLAKIQIPSDEIRFLGQAYKLKFDENINFVSVEQGKIIAPNQKELDKFMLQKAKEIFEKYIKFYSPKINKPINHVSIKKMTTRWGSCNSKKGYINLNLNLIQKDERFIEYVVLHELTHLIYPHHQNSFYEFIQSLMPDYKSIEKL